MIRSQFFWATIGSICHDSGSSSAYSKWAISFGRNSAASQTVRYCISSTHHPSRNSSLQELGTKRFHVESLSELPHQLEAHVDLSDLSVASLLYDTWATNQAWLRLASHLACFTLTSTSRRRPTSLPGHSNNRPPCRRKEARYLFAAATSEKAAPQSVPRSRSRAQFLKMHNRDQVLRPRSPTPRRGNVQDHRPSQAER
jgi:hypothetical protein